MNFLFFIFPLLNLHILFFFSAFQGCACDIWEFSGQGSNWSYSCHLKPQPKQHGIQAMSATYTTAHGNARSFFFFFNNEFYYIYRCTTIIITTKFYSISISNPQSIPYPPTCLILAYSFLCLKNRSTEFFWKGLLKII